MLTLPTNRDLLAIGNQFVHHGTIAFKIELQRNNFV